MTLSTLKNMLNMLNVINENNVIYINNGSIAHQFDWRWVVIKVVVGIDDLKIIITDYKLK